MIVKICLAFWAQAMHDPALDRLQRINEKCFLSHLRNELKRVTNPKDADFLATAVASLIDRIWLRGALNPNGIDADLAKSIINDYLESKNIIHLTKNKQAVLMAVK
jgi:TetR/AcrR family transcriptional repressor of bet genes